MFKDSEKVLKIRNCRIGVTDFRAGGLFCPSSVSSPEKAHLE